MYWNNDLLTDDQQKWYESEKGNWYRKNHADQVLATVFRNSYGAWQIIINIDGVGRLVANEYFPKSAVAQNRAQEILDGAKCRFLAPRSSSF